MIYQLIDQLDDGRCRTWTGRASDALLHFERLVRKGSAPRITDYKGRAMQLSELRSCAASEGPVPAQSCLDVLTSLMLAGAHAARDETWPSLDEPEGQNG